MKIILGFESHFYTTQTEGNVMYLAIYVFAEALDTTEMDYNITCRIYCHSSIVHLSSYYQAYVAKSQGRRWHMGKGVDRSQTKGLTLPWTFRPAPDRPGSPRIAPIIRPLSFRS